MDEKLVKFVEGTLAIDMEGTDVNDWRTLVQAFSRIGYDLDQAARIWWDTNKPNMLPDATQPFVEYEWQNYNGKHFKYPYLCRYRDYIHSVLHRDFTEMKEAISCRELLRLKEIHDLEFDINFYV